MQELFQLDGVAAEQGAAARVHLWPRPGPASGPPGPRLPCPRGHPAQPRGQERQPRGGGYQGPRPPEQTRLQDSARPLGQGLPGQRQEVSGQGQDRRGSEDAGSFVPTTADLSPEIRRLRAPGNQ